MERKFILSCCSTVDLPYSYMQSRDIHVLFYTYVVDGQEYVDDMGRDPEALPRFYRFLEAGKLPQTSQINVGTYLDFFEAQLEKGDLLHIAFTSGQSGSVHNAVAAAKLLQEKYPDKKLVVIDSLCSSSGYGLLVLEAAQLTREGQLTAQEIAHEMERRRELLDVSFLVERLDFLHKGGRCSGVALLGANMLNLRPCIQVKDGQMMVGKKYRGSYVSCLLQYIRERLKGRDDIDTRRIFITESGGFTPEELAQVEAAVRSYQPFDEVLHTRAGCTVSSHCGPRTLGILYFHTK